MRRIQATMRGSVVDEILVFQTEQEREEYFEQARREADLEHKSELADLLRGYQVGTQKAREAYGRARNSIEQEERKSLLESDLALPM